MKLQILHQWNVIVYTKCYPFTTHVEWKQIIEKAKPIIDNVGMILKYMYWLNFFLVLDSVGRVKTPLLFYYPIGENSLHFHPQKGTGSVEIYLARDIPSLRQLS